MSKETVLFQVEWSHKWDEVDFTVYPSIDKYLKNEKDRQEIIAMMEKLLNRIKNNEYPFKV